MSSVKTPKTGRRWVTVVGAILATTAMTLSLGASASATPGPASPCKAVSFPVTLEHSPQAQTIAGRLCGPRNTKVQVLVPGYTYNSTYWDFGYRPETYSYARYAVARGQSVLLIDRLGTGRSSKPDALSLTLFEHAHTLHQVVQALRTGRVGPVFTKVAVVGHSLGAATAQTEASRYHDVDAVILSDWLHTPWTGTFDVVFGTNLPASAVPWLAGRPAGYNTTFDGIRARFYNLGNTDPRVVAHDENTRDTGTLAEAATIPLVTFNPAVTQGITAPVLLAVGQYDSIFCGPVWPCDSARTVVDRERPNFSGTRDLSGYVLPNAGHNINLHRNSQEWFAVATRWVDERLR